MTLLVETVSGPVKGFRESGEKGDIAKFLGIPYCQSPTGELRFAPPKPHDPWSEVFEANEFSKISIQPPPDPTLAMLNDPYNIDEDCLTLNIFVPGEPSESTGDTQLIDKKAVMVWIHGGGFVTGASSGQMYNATNLALLGDVIVVTLNYRLGALGFLAVETEESIGNFGILDQIAALRWVKDNIAEFGGDPENITIFGESAGSMSVSTLVAIPAAKGLFNRAICESGAPAVSDLESALKLKEKFMQRLNLQNEKDLLAVDPADILRVQNEIANQIGYDISLPFLPIIDGILIKEHPYETFKEGRENPVDLIVGSNKDEMLLFSLTIPDLEKLEFDMLPGLFDKTSDMMRGYSSVVPKELLDDYRKLLRSDITPLKLWCAIATDLAFRIPGVKIAKVHSDFNGRDGSFRTYLYRFDWVSSFLSGQLGSCHALEIPFVFNLLENPLMGMFGGSDRPEAQGLADFIGQLWTNFAKTGSPHPDWSEYDQKTQKIMIFNAESKCVDDDSIAFNELWP